MKQLSEIIKGLREDADLNQSDVAQHLGIPQQTYSNYERGKYELPTRHLLPLAQLYNVNVEYLMGATDYKTSLKSLNKPFVSGISVAAVLSNLMELNRDGRKAAVEYIEFLNTKRTMQ